jgi:hypothetical protein
MGCTCAQHPAWPRQIRPLMELFEGAKPYDRPALAERVEQLARSGAACADGLPGRLLLDQPLQSLHPASWCAGLPHMPCADLYRLHALRSKYPLYVCRWSSPFLHPVGCCNKAQVSSAQVGFVGCIGLPALKPPADMKC